jgi:hypothetical protein
LEDYLVSGNDPLLRDVQGPERVTSQDVRASVVDQEVRRKLAESGLEETEVTRQVR